MQQHSTPGTAQHSPIDPVPLLDINRENAPLRTAIRNAINSVCDSGRFILGPDVQNFEQRIAARTGAAHAVGCASGSDALLLALMAIDLQPGEEVILPSFTFFATGSAVWRLGGIPVFADIDPQTFNIDPDRVADLITDRTKAVIPVHLFGQMADMTALNALAAKHDFFVIEDAAQAIGAAWNGAGAGSLGHIGCFSFYPTKNLGGLGDGGMLTTNDERLAERLRLLRGHGMHPRYYHAEVGINSRLDSIQAAALNVKLDSLDQWTESRQQNAGRYAEWFAATRHAAGQIVVPTATDLAFHVWNQFTIRVPDGRRDQLRAYLSDCGIGSEIYYPIPLHQQACFQSLAPLRQPLPESEQAAAEVLSLPIFPAISQHEQRSVVAAVEQFYATLGRPAPVALNPSHGTTAHGTSQNTVTG